MIEGGRMGEVHFGKIDIDVNSSLTANARVFRPAAAFLDIAAILAVSDERMNWNLSVVCGAIACEIATERTIVAVGKHRQQQGFVEQNRKPSRGKTLTYKMNAKETRRVYRTLTNDDITEPITEWDKYEKLVCRRDKVLHEADQQTKAEADECLDIARDFVARLDRIGQQILAEEQPSGD
jgi:hypothetical protein